LYISLQRINVAADSKKIDTPCQDPSIGSDGLGHLDTRLIFDIGFHIGDDSAYYLSQGYRVVGVDANPAMIQEGHKRFSKEIASRQLTILNAAMWHTSGEKISFYVNQSYPGKSSLDPDHDELGGKCYQIDVETISVADLFKTYGVPWYMKMDIEGADEMVVRNLPSASVLPKYFSCELTLGRPMVDLLASNGYVGFKLINGGTLTQSLEIYDNEIFIRALRKAGCVCRPIRSLIAGLPKSMRPKKTHWDPPRLRVPSQLSDQTTGPFGEEADGEWLSADGMKHHVDNLFAQHTSSNLGGFWYDLHAKHI